MSVAGWWQGLSIYWSPQVMGTNGLVFLNLLGALALGSLVGYERSYHGRAAGMRTYGLVCMASAGVTAMAGFPAAWYGGAQAAVAVVDPTRVVQGIVTGVGFLGAGVIMRDGLNISGLTTAASIWAAACIGVMIGVGLYAAAILLALLCAVTMMWGSRVENLLPSHHAVAMSLRYQANVQPNLIELKDFLTRHGYTLAEGSMAISSTQGGPEWRFITVVIDRRTAATMDRLAHDLPQISGVADFALSHARN